MMNEPVQTATRNGHAANGAAPKAPLLSIITPAYNESANLPLLFERLKGVLDSLKIEWEWIVIDDHSADATFAIIADLARRDPRVRGLRFARNFGSHTAIACGLHQARGSCVGVMAADLQDPPETLPLLLERWREGAQIVWAVRRRREGEKISTLSFSRLYYFLMRRVIGITQMPPTGADFFLLDRCVADAFRQFPESNGTTLGLLTWMGFRQTSITYDKQARVHGRSGWNLEKKLKLVLDSVTSFSYLPMRIMSGFGFVVAVLGFLYAAVVMINAFFGVPPLGWSSLMATVLILGGMQMLMMGVLGEYVWRILDEARRRPRYVVEAATEGALSQAHSAHF